MKSFKTKVQLSFDNGSINYDKYSGFQTRVLDSMLKFLFDELDDKVKTGSLLDLGCGTGEASKELLKKINFKSVHLMDISKKMLEQSKEKLNKKKIDFFQIDFDNFTNFKDYDFIISNMSLHWSLNLKKLLIKMLKSIRKDTTIILSIPNNKSLRGLKRNQRDFTNNFPNKCEIDKILDKNKFYVKTKEVVFLQKFNSIFHFLKNLKKIGADISNRSKKRNLFSLRKENKEVIVDFSISYIYLRKLANDE